MNIVVDGLLTNYQRVGKGKTLLLLHGWGDSAKAFQPFVQQFSQNYDVIALDLPGFGQTQPPQEVWGLDDYAGFVAAFIKKLGVDSVYALVGHSNGGAIAIRGLGNQQLQSEKLILLASAGIRGEYRGRKRILRAAAKVAKAATAPLPKRVQSKLKKRAYATIGSDLFVAEHLQETFKKVVTDDVLADARKLTLPTLLVYGSQDEATPPRYGEQLHKAIAGSTLKLIDQAGHFLPTEHYVEVAPIIKEFLNA
jgi:pimeloyl-ACP methyl ester carboxylesterase